ncbi:MAG: LysE family transporter [Anaerolineae bacterium]|jgi:threonine/homoserine/homoserine lactone efflux protein
MTSLLLRGIIIGFSIAAPVGPIGVLCIKRTLTEGHAAGFITGLGAATADAVYGSVAGFGLTFISGLLVDHRLWIRLVGGLFLCYLGARAFFTEPTTQMDDRRAGGLVSAFGSTFILTLTNPMTILAFAAIFAGLGAAQPGRDYASAVALVVGVFGGSVLWWFALSSIASLFRGRLDVRGLRWVSRVSGIVVTGFGIGALAGLL